MFYNNPAGEIYFEIILRLNIFLKSKVSVEQKVRKKGTVEMLG